jgi:hypothetical protein
VVKSFTPPRQVVRTATIDGSLFAELTCGCIVVLEAAPRARAGVACEICEYLSWQQHEVAAVLAAYLPPRA